MADLTITYSISSDKIDEYKNYFLLEKPNEEQIRDPEDESQWIPKYTDREWVKECGLRWFKRIIRQGKKISDASNNVPLDVDGMITV